MRAQFRTIEFLAATTAVSTGVLPAMSLSVGLAIGSTAVALADDPTMVPLEYVKEKNGDFASRLGIWAAINNGKAQRYIFDTGSDQLNMQIGSEVTGVQPVAGRAPYVYTYGDSTYGYKLQTVDIDKLTYSDPNDLSKTIDAPKAGNETYKVGKIQDFIYSQGYSDFDKIDPEAADVKGKLKDIYGDLIAEEYYADLNQRRLMNQGKMAEEGGKFAGTFGAGDYLFNSSAWGMMGSATRSGYIVSANTDYSNTMTPGCSPCTIINLNPGLRAQFTNIMAWGNQSRGDVQSNFPGSSANASTLLEGNYDFQFTAVEGKSPISEKSAALLDTGSPGSASVTLSETKFNELKAAGVKFKEVKDSDGKIVSYTATIPSLTIAAPNGDPVELDKIDVTYANEGAKKTTVIVGLDFFLSQSVVYDLEKKTTAYTPYFVSADNFTTDAGGLNLSKITRQMGKQDLRDKLDDNGKPVLDKDGNPVQETIGMLGIAGVVSGTGALTLDSYTDVRMTNVNTYSGATYIGQDASLSLAGLGSIERSAKVVANGTLDISEHGKANPYWGISGVENDARVRSLSGASSGWVALGDRNLILTAASDTFAGTIHDYDDDRKNHLGGGLVVAGGVQTLSGKNNYTGMTTVGQGAGLLLADSGSITDAVTTSGLLGNDGQIGGVALAKDGGVVVGAGSFGAITVADGGRVAPGSAFDPGRQIAKLTVKGNFTQQAGSIYEAGLGKSSDRIDVAGSAAIDSATQVELVRDGAMSINAHYNLLTAAGGVNGTYGGLTGALATDTPFVDFELAYDPKNVFLDTERTATTFAEVADTFNQRSTAAASETLGDGNPIHDSILFLTTQESRNAFDQLSGEVHASAKSALIEGSHFERDAINDRLRAAFEGVGTPATPVLAYGEGGPVLAPSTTDRLAAWGRAFGSWGSFDGDGNAAALDTSTGGLLTGFDGSINDTVRLGIMAGYSHTSFDSDHSSGSSDNYHLGLYGGKQWGNLGFRSGLAYTWHDIETSRSVAMPGFADSLSGDYNAGTFQAYGELGYRIDTQVAAFEPFANLAYLNLHTDVFTEKGGGAALTSRGETTDTTFTTLGLRASTGFTLGTMNATARGMLGWRHAFGDITPTATHAFAGSDAFTVAGVPIAKDAVLLEAGLDLNITETATLGVSYRGQFGSGVQENGFNAKLNVRF